VPGLGRGEIGWRKNRRMRHVLRSLFVRVQRRCRNRRAGLFRRYLHPSAQDRILDLGGGYGDYFATVVPFREKVWMADINEMILQWARRYGFQTALIPTDGSLPFPDQHFDIVHCNSVIEHVLVPEDRARLAAEIQRVGKTLPIQTPNRYFIVEPRTCLPLGRLLRLREDNPLRTSLLCCVDRE
jgi:2-polyprenyl-3-methyl-5-hydroxy-6-metoxy-1,4-benzoquinol methylase